MFDIDDSWRSLLVASYTFDAHVTALYPVLGAGGRLYSFPKMMMLEQISEIISKHKINYIQCTPTLLASLDFDIVSKHLRHLTIGGEALPANLMKQWAGLDDGTRMYNAYGPTEAAVIVTTVRCTPDMAYPSSIGRPLCNVCAYIVDPPPVLY